MSDEIEPVVVDSPLPTGEAPPSLESVLGLPESRQSDDKPLELEPMPVEKTAVAAPVAADAVKAIGDTYGIDLSRFKDAESAQAAADLIFAQYAGIEDDGGLFDSAPPVAPAAKPAEVAAPEDLLAGIDESTADPAIVKALKAMAAKNTAIEKQLADAETRQKQQAEQQEKAIEKHIDQRADAHLANANAELFGEPGKRTPMQKMAAKNMMGMVKQTISNMRKAGRQSSPSIESLVEIVTRHYGMYAPKKAAGQPPAAQPFSLPPKTAVSGGPQNSQRIYVSEGNDPNGYFKEGADPRIRAVFMDALKGG